MERIQLNNTHAYSDFICEEERLFFLDWINKNISSNQRVIMSPEDIPDAPLELIEKYKLQIIQLENIKNFLPKAKSGNFVWIEGENSTINYHFDKNFDKYVHTRYNLILSYPEQGGHSIYGDKVNVLQEKMLWKCIAGKIKHGATKVIGVKPRVTLSISFFIHESELIQEYEKVKNFETIPEDIKQLM